MLGRLRDGLVLAALCVGFNVALAGSWLYGLAVAGAELLALGLMLVLSLFVRP